MTQSRQPNWLAPVGATVALLATLVGTWLTLTRPAVNEAAKAAATAVTVTVTKGLADETAERKFADEKMDTRYNDRMKRVEDGVAELLKRVPAKK